MKKNVTISITERITRGIGSPVSLAVHTIIFIGFFAVVILGFVDLTTMLLVLTTAVSLEAIYLALLIQMTVNENTKSLREVEEDIDEIQEDVEELGEDLDEIQEDIEEINEDVGEIQEDLEELGEDIEELNEDDAEEEQRDKDQAVTLEQLTNQNALRTLASRRRHPPPRDRSLGGRVPPAMDFRRADGGGRRFRAGGKPHRLSPGPERLVYHPDSAGVGERVHGLPS